MILPLPESVSSTSIWKQEKATGTPDIHAQGREKSLYCQVAKQCLKTQYAYLDTGSDSVVIPRDLWVKLGLGMLYRANATAV
jgi:hypothetical protein